MNFVGIVTYNCPHFLREQTDRIKKYLKGDYEIFVADNSNEENGEKIKNICHQNNLIYVKPEIEEKDYSGNHAYALNYIYTTYGQEYNNCVFFDHDIFLFKECNFFNELNEYSFIGLAQHKTIEQEERIYLHPACIFISNKFKKKLDFRPTAGMDTGGRLYKMIEISNVKYLSLQYEDDYEIIGDCFFHFIKGSNWNNNPKHNERIEKLFNILKSK